MCFALFDFFISCELLNSIITIFVKYLNPWCDQKLLSSWEKASILLCNVDFFFHSSCSWLLNEFISLRFAGCNIFFFRCQLNYFPLFSLPCETFHNWEHVCEYFQKELTKLHKNIRILWQHSNRLQDIKQTIHMVHKHIINLIIKS